MLSLLTLRPNVDFSRDESKSNLGRYIKLRSSVGTYVEPKDGLNPRELNRISKKFSPERGLIYIFIQIFNFLLKFVLCEEIDISVPVDDLQMFYPCEADG